jgi:uncharacterized membrane protein
MMDRNRILMMIAAALLVALAVAYVLTGGDILAP